MGAANSDTEVPPWYRIGFSGAGGIASATPFDKSSVQRAFPDGRIVESEVYTYGESRNGFHVYFEDYAEPIYKIYPDHTEEYVFAIFSSSPVAIGPNKSKIGETNYNELRDLEEWETCGWGYEELSNTLICFGSHVRVMFVAPEDFKQNFSDAPQEVKDRGVLSEIMYWPGQPRQ